MASAKFLEEALSNDVDESVVSDIVGSLENLDSSTSLPVSGPLQTKLGYQTRTMPTNTSGSTSKPLAIHPLVIKHSINNQVNVHGRAVTGNISSGANVVTSTKAINQQAISSTAPGSNAGQPILPNVQFVNVRSGAPLTIQKTMANVSPRVVLSGHQGVATRAASPALTLQSLPGLQTGQPGGAHLLLKTESGQYQLLRVGPAPGSSTISTQPGQAIRMSTIQSPQGIATASTSVAAVNPQPISNIIPAQPQQMSTVHSSASAGQQQQPQPPTPPNVTTTKPSDNTKEKCRNFLANLLDLSSKEPESVERNVRNLIQELIDDRVHPEEFCDRLERLLNASPQPCLIGFLQKSLPLLRQSMVTKELSIEGILPPPVHVAYPANQYPAPSPIQTHQQPPIAKQMVLPSLPRGPQVSKSSNISVLQNIPVQVSKMVSKQTKMGPGMNSPKSTFVKPAMASTQVSVSSPLPKPLAKDKKANLAPTYTQPFIDIDKMVADDDINDVAAMGGVNLAEESQRILGSTELIGTQIRSCRDEVMVPSNVMSARLLQGIRKHGLDEPNAELAILYSHALQEYMKNVVEKLSVIAEHRIDPLKMEPQYIVTQDVKAQLKFMEDVDRVERKKRDETEREQLLRAAKSRSKTEDPEQAKLKAKAKEMQRVEMEELRQREANLTALQAIGPRKKPRMDMPGDGMAPSTSMAGPIAAIKTHVPVRSRMKRANLRQLTFLLENEKTGTHSKTVYLNYLKS